VSGINEEACDHTVPLFYKLNDVKRIIVLTFLVSINLDELTSYHRKVVTGSLATHDLARAYVRYSDALECILLLL
jgi:hypothetical protein